MFTNYFTNNSSDYKDVSLHGGIPKEYYSLKDKNFSDWEIAPWELIIYKDRLLGKGSFANVYLAKWRETLVVAKVVDTEIVTQRKNLVVREITNMTKLHHPNIVQLLGYIDEPFIIIMEYIPRGDLLNNMNKLWKSEKKIIMKNVLQALAYFHNRKPDNLIHRDIKLTNILLTNSKVAKITDFGLSRLSNMTSSNSHENIINLTDTELTSIVGTERYRAPELPSTTYTNKIDIYAAGIVFYEMFENKRYNPESKLTWFWTPKKIKNIIVNHMLTINPLERSSALEILKKLDKII